MPDFNPPSARPQSTGNLLAQMLDTMRIFVRDELDDCLPCRVENVTATGVDVQILPLMILADGSTMKRAVLTDIPVAWPGNKSAMVRFKLQAGDLGLLKATDRDITLILQQMAEAKPNTLRRHSFSDAFFMPMDFSSYTEAGDGDLVLQTRDGSTFVSVGASGIDLNVSGAEVNLTSSELSATIGAASVSVTASKFSVTIGGVPMEYDGVGLKIGPIDIGPLHTHTSAAPGSPTGPVLP